jgi:hypothetical protein
MGTSVEVYSFWGVQLNSNRFADECAHFIDEDYLLEEEAREAGLKIVNTGNLDFLDGVTKYVALTDGVEEAYYDGAIDEPKKPSDEEWERIYAFVGKVYGQEGYRIDPMLFIGAYVG